MKLYLTRHGETLFNQLGMSQGWCDSPLTDLGIKQGERIGELLSDVKFNAIYSSTSERAVDTANLINNQNKEPVSEIIETKLLKEVNFGILEGMPNKLRYAVLDVQRDGHTYVDEIKQGYQSYGGESYDDIQSRARNFVNQLESDHSNNDCILLVAHGGILRIILSLLFPDEEYEKIGRITNAGCVIVEKKEKYELINKIDNDVSRETK